MVFCLTLIRKTKGWDSHDDNRWHHVVLGLIKHPSLSYWPSMRVSSKMFTEIDCTLFEKKNCVYFPIKWIYPIQKCYVELNTS